MLHSQTSHHEEEIVCGPPGLAGVQAADPGGPQAVVEQRVGDVHGVRTHQEERDTQPLRLKVDGSRFDLICCFFVRFRGYNY